MSIPCSEFQIVPRRRANRFAARTPAQSERPTGMQEAQFFEEFAEQASKLRPVPQIGSGRGTGSFAPGSATGGQRIEQATSAHSVLKFRLISYGLKRRY